MAVAGEWQLTIGHGQPMYMGTTHDDLQAVIPKLTYDSTKRVVLSLRECQATHWG